MNLNIMKKWVLVLFSFLFIFYHSITKVQTKHDLQVVRLQLRWDNQFQFAGYYAADWQGFYAAEGIKVQIISAINAGPDILSSIEEVAQGRADFGIGSSDILIANDQGADLRVLAVIMQRSAARFYLKTETPYVNLTDLTKLKVARQVNDLIDIELQAMLINEGIDPQLVQVYPHQSGMDHLINDQVQVIPGYTLGIPFTAQQKEVSIIEINPQKYGVDFYGDSLFANGDLVDNNPELVERFTRASLKGWEYALNNSEAIASQISTDLTNFSEYEDVDNFNLYQAQVMKELTGYPIVDIGHINPYRWQKMSNFLLEVGLIKAAADINQLIFDPAQQKIDQTKQQNQLLVDFGFVSLGLLGLLCAWSILLRRAIKKKKQELSLIQSELFETERKYKLITDCASDVISVYNITLDKFTYVSPSVFAQRGYTIDEVMQQKLEAVISADYVNVAAGMMQCDVKEFLENPNSNKSFMNILKQPCKNGDDIWVEVSTKFQFNHAMELESVNICREITERKKFEDQLLTLSYRDQLTGLYNRRFYEEELIRLNDVSMLPVVLIMVDVNGLKITNDAFGHKVGDDLLKRIADIFKSEFRNNEVVSRIGGDEFVVLLPKTLPATAKQIMQRITETLKTETAHNSLMSLSIGYAIKETMTKPFDETFKEAEDDMYRQKLTDSSSFRSKSIDIIMNSLYEKSSREMHHSKRVSVLCEQLALAIGFNSDEIRECRVAGLVHDIGKIGVSNAILDKAGKLNDEEWSEMKKHPEMSYRILSSVIEFSEIAKYVLSHHEKFSGFGYPHGLLGEQIPMQSRIIAVADAYDAMTVDRIYRKALSEAEAIIEIKSCTPSQFDPMIAKIFVEIVLGKKW